MISAPIPVSAGARVNYGLGFWARSASVNNLGGQWLTFPDAGNATIAPYTVGAVVSFPYAVQVLNISTLPPTGQSNDGSGQPAQVIASTDAAAGVAGIQIQKSLPTVTLVASALAYATNIAAGRSLVAFVTNGTRAFIQGDLTDQAGNNWHLVGQVNAPAGQWEGCYFCASCNAVTAGQTLSLPGAMAQPGATVVDVGLNAALGTYLTASVNSATVAVGPLPIDATMTLALSSVTLNALAPQALSAFTNVHLSGSVTDPGVASLAGSETTGVTCTWQLNAAPGFNVGAQLVAFRV